MRKTVSKMIAVLVFTGVIVAVPTVASAEPFVKGTTSCEVFQTGKLRTSSYDNAYGYVNGVSFSKSWDSFAPQTNTFSGKKGGGKWDVSSSGGFVSGQTWGYCG